MDLKNELSWSKSREGLLRKCPRQYFYRYYGGWGGWEDGADPQKRELYILSKLKSRHMWAGEVVHDCIERTLKNIETGIDPLPPEKILEITRDRMREAYKSSKQGLYRDRPKTCALFEHEFKESIQNSEWKRIADHVDHCLKTFYKSDIYAEIRSLPVKNWLEVERLAGFNLSGTHVHVKLDFAYQKADGIVIIDWKTGRWDSGDNSIQLACYARYAQEKWGVEPGKITTMEFNLATGKSKGQKCSPGSIKSVESYILGSIEDMKKYLRNVENNEAHKMDFKATENAETCRRCNYQKICPDSLAAK